MKKQQPVYPIDKVKPVVIAKPENIKLANEFLQIIIEHQPKLRNQFNSLAYKNYIFNTADVEDIFNNTLLKCIETIRKRGFDKDNDYTKNGFISYFTEALKWTTVDFKKKLKEDPANNAALVSESRYDEEHYLMYVSRNLPFEIEDVDDELIDDDNDVDIEKMYQEMVKKIKLENAFNQLSPEMKEVVSLRFHSLKYCEISRTLGIPISTVKSRLFIARGILKKRK